MMVTPLLEFRQITKIYPGVVALNDVSLSISAGEVVGFIGENGAGKSTLMKILGGVTQPTLGSIHVDGEEKRAFSVPDAIAAGIAFVHQELNLFDNLDVAANIFIGREPRYGGLLNLVDRPALDARSRPLLDRLGGDFAPDTPLSQLSLAQRQLVEIAKALSLDARIVIMDEPTSSLTLSETERLLRVIRELKSQGVSIILISHRLHEIEACADRVVILRDGKVVGELAREDIRNDRMIRMMIGRDLKSLYLPPKAPPGEAVLELLGIRTARYPARSVDLKIHRGEILGLAGLVGSGRTELARAIFGIEKPLGGAIRLGGKEIAIKTPRDAIACGIYLVPEDRKRAGLLLDVSVAENISLADLNSYARHSIVIGALEIENAERQSRKLNIRAPGVTTAAGALSGGNQQKVVLARWLSMHPSVMIFDEPTRGIDVGAKNEIYDLMRQLAETGVGILMISSDMEEVIGVSDRIAVMQEGGISGFLERRDFSETNVLQLAVGNKVN